MRSVRKEFETLEKYVFFFKKDKKETTLITIADDNYSTAILGGVLF